MAITTCGRWTRSIAALVCVVLTMTGAVTLLERTASAAPGGAPHEGLGYRVGGDDFVGFYRMPNGRKIYCLSPRKKLPASVRLEHVSRYPGIGLAKSRQLSYALGRWGDAKTAHAAAAESQLVNTIVGNEADVARRAKGLPKSVSATVRTHLAATRHFHGPYRTAVAAPDALLPGQSSDGTVVVRSANGHRVPGITIELSGSPNVSVPTKVSTGSTGVARFTYRVTDIGEVHIRALATHLPRERILVNEPGADEQHMVGRVKAYNSEASVSFRRSPTGFNNSYACTTTCDGKPATTLGACGPASGRASRITFHFGTKTARIVFPAAKSAVCKHAAVVSRDGDHVWARWQFLTSHGWSKPVVAEGSFDVDCPPAPSVGITMSYDCTQAALTIGLAKLGPHGTWTPLVNATSHRMVLVIGGAEQRRLFADQGKRAMFTTTLSCDNPQTYTAQAGVLRDRGGYNYGAVASVTTPGPPK